MKYKAKTRPIKVKDKESKEVENQSVEFFGSF
jgi:hypothetical protein